MAATVMRDNAETALREEQHLAIPSVGVQRPAVRECHDRTFAPSPYNRFAVPSLVVIVLICFCFLFF